MGTRYTGRDSGSSGSGGGDADRPDGRARRAARHAEQLYPGVLGRLVARELRTYADAAMPAPLAESVVAEVLSRTPTRAELVRSGELRPVVGGASLRERHHRRHDPAGPVGGTGRVERSARHAGRAPATDHGKGHAERRRLEIGSGVG